MCGCRCEPNVQLSYLKGNRDAAVIAMRPIHAHEEININYVDVNQPSAMRQADLKHYGFVCVCPRCVEDSSASSDSSEEADVPA